MPRRDQQAGFAVKSRLPNVTGIIDGDPADPAGQNGTGAGAEISSWVKGALNIQNAGWDQTRLAPLAW